MLKVECTCTSYSARIPHVPVYFFRIERTNRNEFDEYLRINVFCNKLTLLNSEKWLACVTGIQL